MQRKAFSWLLAIAAVAFISVSASAQNGQLFVAHLNSIQEVPPTASTGYGRCTIRLNAAETQITVNCTYTGLTTNVVASHIHDMGPVGVNGPIRFNFNYTGGTSGTIGPLTFAVTPAQVEDARSKEWYVNIHSQNFPGGEIRGQVKPSNTVQDYEGDGTSDITVFRFTNATLYSLWSRNSQIQSPRIGSGTNSDIFLNNTGDFDGDGRTDALVLALSPALATNAPLYWSIGLTATNTIRTIQWGNFASANGETLAPGDYNGDGAQDIAVYRRATGTWYILESPNFNTPRYEFFGVSSIAAGTNFPTVGDFDKDGRDDLTVIVNEGGQRVWYTRRSSNGQVIRVPFGLPTDAFFFFAQTDFDGDGAQDRLVFRTENGQTVYYALLSSNNQILRIPWGLPTDTALFGDYYGNVSPSGVLSGDGKTDIVARRDIGGVFNWFILDVANQTARQVQFGQTGDQRPFGPGSGKDLSLPVSSNEVEY